MKMEQEIKTQIKATNYCFHRKDEYSLGIETNRHFNTSSWENNDRGYHAEATFFCLSLEDIEGLAQSIVDIANKIRKEQGAGLKL
jgi:hypothetical protein